MAKLPLTPQQKADKKIRDQLILAHNQVTSAWSFGEIRTWEGIYSKLGYGYEHVVQHPELKKGSCTFPELKDFLQKQKDALECEKYFKTTAGWRRIHNMLKYTLQA